MTAYKNASISEAIDRWVWLRRRLQKFSVLMVAGSLGDHRCPVTGIGGAGAGAGNRDMNNTRYLDIPEYAEHWLPSSEGRCSVTNGERLGA